MATDKPITRNQLAFVAEYCATYPRNATQAYLRVFDCSYETACCAGPKMTQDPRVAAEISRWEEELRTDRKIEAAWVLNEILSVANADPAELIDSRTGACRCCYGEGFKRQYTPEELRQALIAYHSEVKRSKLPPDPCALNFDYAGGAGFNHTLPPVPECPECHGDGVTYERIKDTRLLSPGARRLYNGVKRTKDGLEVKIRDRDKHIEMAARHVGILKENVNVNFPGGIPPISTISTVTNDPVEAAKVYQAMIAG